MRLIDADKIPWIEVRICGIVDDIVTPDEIDKMPTYERLTKSEFKRMAIQLGYEQVITANWIASQKSDPDEFPMSYKCNHCNTSHRNMSKYCPECGAKMEICV